MRDCRRSRRRRGSHPPSAISVATMALLVAACLCKGSDGSASSGYPGAGAGGAAPPGGYPRQEQQQQQQQQQQQYQPRQQQQQQQQQQQPYRPGGLGHGQAPGSQVPPTSASSSGSGGGGGGGSLQDGAAYGRGTMPPSGYRSGQPSSSQQYYAGYGRATTGQGQGGYGAGGYGGGSQAGYGGRSVYPSQGMQQQQQPGGDGGGSGFFSRLTNRLKGLDGQQQGAVSSGGQQGYDDRYGGGGGGSGGSQYAQPGRPPQGWQPPTRPGMALQPTGPSRGPIQSTHNQPQDNAYGSSRTHDAYASQQHHSGGASAGDNGFGLWSRFKGKVFQGDTQGGEEGPPSFRPNGSVLRKKEESVANGSGQAFGGPGAYGNPYPSFGGPPGLGMGETGGAAPEPTGPGVPEVMSVEKSIVMVPRPNELAKKKRKFKQDGANRLQVITTFDHCLTAFQAKDGKTACLKTTDVLEQNQHVMLPDAAKKVRYLRSDFKRRMEADGKAMSPEERVAALEDNLRKVYSVVSMEGGVHMNSIGPAIESQLDSIPLRDGVDDMTAALAWRAIPMTIFCAGYGNVAMEVLRRGSPKITGPGGVFTPHLRLVANFFRPDDTMTIIGMYHTVPLIHEAKKSGATLMDFLRSVRQENVFSARSNVLLLGSELSDLGLASGLPAVDERISVGFLKLDEHVLEKLPRYAQAYDVVIIGDGDMSYTNEMLHEIVE